MHGTLVALLTDDSGRTHPPPRGPGVSAPAYVGTQIVLLPLLIAALAWELQHGSFDLRVAHAFADPTTQEFIWRDSTVLEVLGHQAARAVPALAGGVALAAALAGSAVDALRPWRPILFTVVFALVLGPVAVSVLKDMTAQHCPFALRQFGGIVDYASEQASAFWAATPSSAGRCLPSGHASGGYALVSLSFAGWAAGRPAWRWLGLAIGLGTGFIFSLVRVVQGAQFVSSTVWSLAVVWLICAALFAPLVCRRTALSP
jgi:membrane-associated PAP2 superfamily phosphatase